MMLSPSVWSMSMMRNLNPPIILGSISPRAVHGICEAQEER